MTPGIVISFPSSDQDVASLAEQIEDLLDGEFTESWDIHHRTRHEEWEQGNPCPECGSTDISTVIPYEDIFLSENGEFRYMDQGDYIGSPLSHMCLDCEELLFHTPYQKV